MVRKALFHFFIARFSQSFPQFGQPDKSYPQHGFLRNNYWALVEGSQFDVEDGAGLSMELALKDCVNARGGKWGISETKFDVKCTFSVKIDGKSMTNTISFENTGTEAFDFQVLLHTYYLVADRKALDGSLCSVHGLEGYVVSDKVCSSLFGVKVVFTYYNSCYQFISFYSIRFHCYFVMPLSRVAYFLL